jgi:uridylate kinase
MDNQIPIIVFDLEKHGNVTRALAGENIGTIVQ